MFLPSASLISRAHQVSVAERVQSVLQTVSNLFAELYSYGQALLPLSLDIIPDIDVPHQPRASRFLVFSQCAQHRPPFRRSTAPSTLPPSTPMCVCVSLLCACLLLIPARMAAVASPISHELDAIAQGFGVFAPVFFEYLRLVRVPDVVNAAAQDPGDMWSFDLSSKLWTWQAGSTAHYGTAGSSYGSLGVAVCCVLLRLSCLTARQLP